jgi:hypothetical protein
LLPGFTDGFKLIASFIRRNDLKVKHLMLLHSLQWIAIICAGLIWQFLAYQGLKK